MCLIQDLLILQLFEFYLVRHHHMLLVSSRGTPAKNEVTSNVESLNALTDSFRWNLTADLTVMSSDSVEDSYLFSGVGCI